MSAAGSGGEAGLLEDVHAAGRAETDHVGQSDLGTVDLSGDLVLPEEDLRRFLLVAEGQTFSQQLVTSTEEYMTRRLGNEGYNFAKVTGIPEVEEGTTVVSM